MWQGRQDSNLQPAVLETAALPIEPRPFAMRPPAYPSTSAEVWYCCDTPLRGAVVTAPQQCISRRTWQTKAVVAPMVDEITVHLRAGRGGRRGRRDCVPPGTPWTPAPPPCQRSHSMQVAAQRNNPRDIVSRGLFSGYSVAMPGIEPGTSRL